MSIFRGNPKGTCSFLGLRSGHFGIMSMPRAQRGTCPMAAQARRHSRGTCSFLRPGVGACSFLRPGVGACSFLRPGVGAHAHSSGLASGHAHSSGLGVGTSGLCPCLGFSGAHVRWQPRRCATHGDMLIPQAWRRDTCSFLRPGVGACSFLGPRSGHFGIMSMPRVHRGTCPVAAQALRHSRGTCSFVRPGVGDARSPGLGVGACSFPGPRSGHFGIMSMPRVQRGTCAGLSGSWKPRH
jgi:hypothetical protein